jgi:predicted GNAT family acetyltransferase
MMVMNDRPVRHNALLHRFELDTPAGLAVADYRVAGNTMTFYHTEVPVPVRGRSYGYRLVRGALDEVRRLNLKVRAQGDRAPARVSGFTSLTAASFGWAQQPEAPLADAQASNLVPLRSTSQRHLGHRSC